MSSLSKNTSSCTEDEGDLRRGPWTSEEDTLLIHYIARHGEGRWNFLAKRAGLRRTGKSCRLRWLNYLKPDVKRGNLTAQEQLLILDLHSKWGNRWSKIAQHLPGRTDNEIKNYWRTRVQKQARHLNIDANSTAFQDIIRCFWMPRLIQKIETSASSSAILSQSSTTSQPMNYAFHHPTQNLEVTGQGGGDLSVGMQCLEHQDQNSDSENCTSSCISSPAESMNNNLSQMSSHFSEYPTRPFDRIDNDNDYTIFMKDCCYVETNCDGSMETINLGGSGFGEQDPAADGHMAEGNLGGYDFADTMWNMDELWQFKNLQDTRN